MEKKSNKGLIILVVVLLIGVICLGGYIVYDKIVSNDTTIRTENNNKDNDDNVENKNIEVEIKQQDASYFDEYLKYFLPEYSAGNFIKNIDSFGSDDITTFLFFYFRGQVDPNLNQYNVSKEELDRVVKTYFGDVEYEIVYKGGRDGIKKISDTEYQVYWFATGWQVPSSNNIGVVYNDKNVEVKYELKDEGGTQVGILTFKLLYSDGNYLVQSIQYDK